MIAADGQVNDGANTDQGMVFDLGYLWEFQPQSTYTVTLTFSNLDNAIVFAGLRTANRSGDAQVQTQGTAVALRIREIAGSDNVGIFQWPGGTFTDSGLSYETNSSATFTLTLQTNNLTDATITVGAAQVTGIDLVANKFRYFFAGYEDPLTGESDAKLDAVALEGPLPPPSPPMPPLRLVSHDPGFGAVTVGWEAAGEDLYTLLRSPDLRKWEPVDGSDLNPFGGVAGDFEFTDYPAGPRQFYRLVSP